MIYEFVIAVLNFLVAVIAEVEVLLRNVPNRSREGEVLGD